MSIINQMLNNLDQRETHSTQGFAMVENSVEVQHIPEPFKFVWPVVYLIVLLVVFTFAYYYSPLLIDKWFKEAVSEENSISEQAQSIEKQLITDNKDNQAKHPLTESNSEFKGALPTAELTPVKKSSVQIPLPVSSKNASVKLEPLVTQSEEKPVIVRRSSTIKRVNKGSLNQTGRAQSLYTAGKNDFSVGAIDSAISQLTNALQIDEKHIEARNLLAAIYFGQGKFEQAETTLRKGLAINSQSTRWRVLLAKILTEQGQFDAVMPVLEDQYEVTANTEFWILKGTAAQQIKSHAVAIRCFEQLRTMQPVEPKWRLALAVSYDAIHQTDKALAHYLEAEKLGGLSASSIRYIQKRIKAIGEQG